MSMETNEVCEWIESLVEDLIKEYKSEYRVYDAHRNWNNGAIEALEELLKRMNE